MNYQNQQDELILKLKDVQQKDFFYEIIFTNEDLCRDTNEFLFFIKPEITIFSETIKYDDILKLIFSKFREYNFIIHDIRILSAAYLSKYNIIAQHYGVINKLSQKPSEYLTQEASAMFKSLYGKSVSEVNLQGSLEFLQNHDTVNVEILESLCQKSKIEKLSGGTYVNRINYEGEEIYIINGFHPRQLEHFTIKGKSIVSFTLSSNTAWKTARSNFIGKTNPAEASEGSIRNELLVNKDKFGLPSVSSSLNGVHLSAGPVEGLVELIRYNSDFSKNKIKTHRDFTFGLRLAELYPENKLNQILSNIVVSYQGRSVPVFDLTEELDSNQALNILKEVIESDQ